MVVVIEYSHAKDLDKENKYMNPLTVAYYL